MSYNEFINDHKTIAATSMMIIALAEITSELPDWFIEKNPEIDWFNIRGMRSRLAHQYRELSLPILYEVLKIKIPELSKKLSSVKY